MANERLYVLIELENNASKRTKERFNKFKNKKHRIEFLKEKVNESLTGDGFVVGELMIYFGIDLFENDLWSRRWEGWIPNKEITVNLDIENSLNF